jgi:hypothetical protein
MTARYPRPCNVLRLGLIGCCAASVWSCAGAPPDAEPSPRRPADTRATISRSLPTGIPERAGWAADIDAALTVQAIEPSRENICAVVAVIAQESGFRVDPVVPGLPAIAWREIDNRAARADVPQLLVHSALKLPSQNGRSFSERIDAAKTEKDLSDVYEDFISAVPMGRTLFADKNPIRTRGPMQVNVAFVDQYAAARVYPYPVKVSIEDEAFTRRGSVYFGTGHLLGYSANYDSYAFRFADYNAGQYASRNAGFQMAVSKISGIQLTADGALLPHEKDAGGTGDTESALRALGSRLNLSDAAIHRGLTLQKKKEFEQSQLYKRVFSLAEQIDNKPAAYAAVPNIKLVGPKISRKLTTAWYANRVYERFTACLKI